MKEELNLSMVVFLFDSGKIENSFYGLRKFSSNIGCSMI